jgi:hypothetical protein
LDEDGIKKRCADDGLRKQTVKFVFFIIKHVMKFVPFMARGRTQIGHEWNLIAWLGIRGE